MKQNSAHNCGVTYACTATAPPTLSYVASAAADSKARSFSVLPALPKSEALSDGLLGASLARSRSLGRSVPRSAVAVGSL